MVKLKISYSSDEELEQLKSVLCPLIGTDAVRVAKQQTGKFKRAYVDVDLEKNLGCLADTGVL